MGRYREIHLLDELRDEQGRWLGEGAEANANPNPDPDPDPDPNPNPNPNPSQEAFDIEDEFKLAIKAIDLEGANLLHVLAAAHQEAPRRLGSKHVDDGGFVGMHLRAMPMSVICTIKPQLRAKFIDSQYNKQHARVEGMLRFAHDVKSEMERHDAHKVTAPRLTLNP